MTSNVRDQILKVRDTGRTNMFDINGVQVVANDLDLFELVVWLYDRNNHGEYIHFIFTGEANIEDGGGASGRLD